MLTPDVRVEGFTATDWSRLLSMAPRRRARPRAPDAPRGGIVAVHSDGRLRKLLHTRTGRIDPRDEPWPATLPDLCDRHRARWAVALAAGAPEELLRRFGARASRADDLVAQGLALHACLVGLSAEGKIDLWPRAVPEVPREARAAVRRALDFVCPDGRCAVVGLFDEGELWTAAVLSRRGAAIDRIVGPAALRPAMGLISGDFRRDYRHLAHAAGDLVGPVAVGLFAETGTVRRLIASPAPGEWAQAVATREVVLSPMPPALAVGIGVDAARAAALALRGLADRLRIGQRLGPALGLLRAGAVFGADAIRRVRRGGEPAG